MEGNVRRKKQGPEATTCSYYSGAADGATGGTGAAGAADGATGRTGAAGAAGGTVKD